MSTEEAGRAAVAVHYTGDPAQPILARILEALAVSGASVDPIDPEALAPVEELHMGGRKATRILTEKLGLTPQTHLLDIGCGIGGAARHMARTAGCAVTGIDLTPDFIAAAAALSQRCGLGDRLDFVVGDATALPFEDGAFDAAATLHAAMNIPNRAGLYREAARVLRPGARFAVYDVMRTGPGDLSFPLPWSSRPEHSFLLSQEETTAALEEAGFAIEASEDWRPLALAHVAPPPEADAPPPSPFDVDLVMGPTGPEKRANMRAAVTQGVVSPVLILARKPGDAAAA